MLSQKHPVALRFVRSACSASFAGGGGRAGCAAAALLTVFSSARPLSARTYWWTARRRRRGRLRLRLWQRLLLGRRGQRGSSRPHATPAPRCRRDGYRFRRHPAFQLGDRLRGRACNVRSQIATAKTSADRHDHGSHACKISRRYPHVSAPSSTRATRGMGRCSGTSW